MFVVISGGEVRVFKMKGGKGGSDVADRNSKWLGSRGLGFWLGKQVTSLSLATPLVLIIILLFTPQPCQQKQRPCSVDFGSLFWSAVDICFTQL